MSASSDSGAAKPLDRSKVGGDRKYRRSGLIAVALAAGFFIFTLNYIIMLVRLERHGTNNLRQNPAGAIGVHTHAKAENLSEIDQDGAAKTPLLPASVLSTNPMLGGSTNTSISSLLTSENPSSLEEIYRQDMEFCRNATHNKVLERNGRTHLVRDYSISEYTFRRHHPTECEEVNSTLRAIRNGQRKWVDESLATVPFEQVNWKTRASYFVPSGCDVPALSSEEMCEILSRWSDVGVDGDSIGRHIRNGMIMGLRGDLARGARMNNQPSPQVDWQCRCDGQFSESDLCRTHTEDLGFLRFGSLTQPGLCPNLPVGCNVSFPHLTSGFQTTPKIDFPCDDPNYRGLLLVLQAGPWFRRQNNWKSAIVEWFQDHFEHEDFQKCLRYNKVDVIWLGYGTTSDAHTVAQYPFQSVDAILDFNDFCRDHLRTMPFPVAIVDWVNLTFASQTSDGFHGLSEVNLVKAYHIMNVAKYLRPSTTRA